MKIYYNPKLKQRAKYLRKNMSKGEVILWNQLKQNKLGFDFHRQKPILNYIVDFYCSKANLVIEIDGSSHDEHKLEYDQKRQVDLENLGLIVIRFSEYEVVTRINDVIETLVNILPNKEGAGT